ncbi:MAG: glycosyltransferase family 2 protein, partial [Erysipelotrichaceae bacterium]|nr:glycosyltransferase family 2 protein [Erysipelotrichaceae bacterium]
MSKVSIIVPVYNREKAIRRCVHSILNQDYHDIEVILVDDGSRDSSFKIISEFA